MIPSAGSMAGNKSKGLAGIPLHASILHEQTVATIAPPVELAACRNSERSVVVLADMAALPGGLALFGHPGSVGLGMGP
jgi:hypothetical protein